MEGSVLVVEHDPAACSLLAGNFRSAGYRVVCARNFSEAAAQVCKVRPDVAVLDWIAGAPGLAFARYLRRDSRTAETSIIVIGPRSEEQAAVAALESGADDYVAKSVATRELLARVKAVLRRRAPQRTHDVVEQAGLRLDPAALRLAAGQREIDLRRTEFRLLHLFMTHPGRAFTRRALLDEIWGDHVFVEERTVDVHVRRLRRALAPTHAALIETVRGVGYRFHPDSAAAHEPPALGLIGDLVRAEHSRARTQEPREHVA